MHALDVLRISSGRKASLWSRRLDRQAPNSPRGRAIDSRPRAAVDARSPSPEGAAWVQKASFKLQQRLPISGVTPRR